MDDSSKQAVATSRENSPLMRDASKLKRELLDRLHPSEALEVVGALLDLYPNGRISAGKPHIAGLAKILCEYPRLVAKMASHHHDGVARETKFIPTPADVIAWCERESIPLQKRYASAKRAADQVEDRDDGPTPGAIVAAARAWLKREDPRAQKLTGQSVEVERVKDEAKRESNREAMERRKAETLDEYDRAGLRPVTIGKIPISIELARIMGVEPTTRRRDEDAA